MSTAWERAQASRREKARLVADVVVALAAGDPRPGVITDVIVEAGGWHNPDLLCRVVEILARRLAGPDADAEPISADAATVALASGGRPIDAYDQQLAEEWAPARRANHQ